MCSVAIILMVLTASLSLGLPPTLAGSAPTPDEQGRGPQSFTDTGLTHTVGTLAGMMREIHQLLHQGPITPKQSQQLSDIMTQIGIMMKEMSGPQAEKYQSLHQRQLEEMKSQLEEIKAQIKSQKR